MSDFSDQLKARADLGQLLGEVVALRPGGNGFIGLCPFHSERTPSFHVHQLKRFYYCFGCHAHGDVFQFFMQLRGIAFPEAVALVAERLGIEVPQSATAPSDAPTRELLRIYASAEAYFERMLAGREGALACQYLQSRDFAPARVAPFHLGYAPEQGHGLARHLEAEGFAPSDALRAGLCQLRRESGAEANLPPASGNASRSNVQWSDLYDRFRHRLIFPIKSERGQTIAFGGRALEASDRGPKYLNSPEHPLYTKGRVLYNLDRARAAIRELRYAILVEGYFDCLRVSLAGFENVVASCGTALTPAQVAALGRLTRKAVVNFDPDSAGRAAAERSVALLLEEDFQMRVVMLDGGLDPDLYVRQKGAAAYAEAMKSSRSFFDYLGIRAREQFDFASPDGKVFAVNYFLPFLSHVHEPILRQGLAENLAAQLGLDQSLIGRQLQQAARQRRPELDAGAVAPVPQTLYAERVLLRAWLEWPARRKEIEAWVEGEGLLAGLGSETVFAQFRTLQEDDDWHDLVAGFDPARQRWLAEIALNQDGKGAQGIEDPPLDQPALQAAVEALRLRRGQQERQGLQARIAAAAARGEKAELEQLLRQKRAADADARREG
ncbi:MAG: DNA primase [Terriglobales bacterium]